MPRIIRNFETRYGFRLTDAAADALLDVKPGYLETMFTAIEAQCGSLDAYLEAEGVDAVVRGRLGEQLLEG
jgi:hypothetical protein